ncbi:inorganic phosphate transporter 1-4-like [Prunus yedoensis var. nudiflora]|uniref:Inorganic phosphate transporter 1-4-like n=1 Tax=Prunus yedoensis var. nudiflora TaxID=2094558 RepID=A0A314ZUD5_PRUYE|nr:inorganic phosphate transporter 1-4-like [Prunus yedoensis var. nudiflora]
MSALDELYKIARAQTLIALCGTVPGYWVTVFLIDHIGRFAIQLIGFFFMTAFMFLLAIPYHHWTRPENNIGFIVIYGLTFFFANFGPNSTTFVVPQRFSQQGSGPRVMGFQRLREGRGDYWGFRVLVCITKSDKSKTDAGYPPGIGMKEFSHCAWCDQHFGVLLYVFGAGVKGKSLEEMSRENEDEDDDQVRPNRVEVTV